MEDGAPVMPPDHPSARQGLGPALAELYSLALPACSLEFSSSPGQKGAEQTTPPQPPTPDTHRVLLLLLCHLLFVHTKSALHTPRLSDQLRALTLWCMCPSLGLFSGTGVLSGAKRETALCWHCLPAPPLSFRSGNLGVSRGWGKFTHGRTRGCCPHGAPLEQCR